MLMADVVVSSTPSGLIQEITAGRHRLLSDEPVENHGQDAGPDPYDLLLASLGACTAMTLKMYAGQKAWPLTHVEVELSHERLYTDDKALCETTPCRIERVTRHIKLSGPLTAEQATRLEGIAKRCPVHQTLSKAIQIVDRVEVAAR